MIEFLNTVITHTAVFRSSRFFKFTGFALIILKKHDIIKFIQLFSFISLLFVLYDTWVDCACFVKAIVAGYHEDRPDYSVVTIYIRTRTIFKKCLFHVDYVPASCYYAIKNLN